jgi:hypothetical protein
MAFGKQSGGGRRSATRVATPLLALLSTSARTYSAIVLDVSATGARLQGERLPGVRHDLQIQIEKVRAFGTVRWRDGDQ